MKISSSVSSSNFKREASPTVCCYYINNRSQSVSDRGYTVNGSDRDSENSPYTKKPSLKSDSAEYLKNFANFNNNKNRSAQQQQQQASEVVSEKKNNFHQSIIDDIKNDNNNTHKGVDYKSISDRKCATREYFLREKIKRFEESGNSRSAYSCKNRTLNDSCTSEFLATAPDDRPAYECVSEISSSNNNKRKYYENDKNSLLLINRDERQLRSQQQRGRRFTAQSEKCKLKYVNDNNNNQVESLKNSTKIVSSKPPVAHSNYCRSAVNESPSQNNLTQKKRNFLDDNDFSFIDSSSSQSASRSSSTSFACDEIDENLKNLRKNRIPKIANISKIKRHESIASANNNNNNSNCNIYDHQLKDTKQHSHSDLDLKSAIDRVISTEGENEQPAESSQQLKASIDRSIPDNSVSWESHSAPH